MQVTGDLLGATWVTANEPAPVAAARDGEETGQGHTLRILLAEDVAMVRGALVALIELEPDFKVVAAVEGGDEIVPAARVHRPDIAIIDIGLPGLDGLSAAALLHDEVPGCKTLILTNLGRAGTLRQALAAHVCGYMLKDAPPEQLARAIRSIAAGHRVIEPQTAVTALEDGQNPLSPRELQVLQWAAEGSEPAEIAAAMHLSLGTVRNYLTTIVTKLNARNRVDAVKMAYDSGWLELWWRRPRGRPSPLPRQWPARRLVPGAGAVAAPAGGPAAFMAPSVDED